MAFMLQVVHMLEVTIMWPHIHLMVSLHTICRLVISCILHYPTKSRLEPYSQLTMTLGHNSSYVAVHAGYQGTVCGQKCLCLFARRKSDWQGLSATTEQTRPLHSLTLCNMPTPLERPYKCCPIGQASMEENSWRNHNKQNRPKAQHSLKRCHSRWRDL